MSFCPLVYTYYFCPRENDCLELCVMCLQYSSDGVQCRKICNCAMSSAVQHMTVKCAVQYIRWVWSVQCSTVQNCAFCSAIHYMRVQELCIVQRSTLHESARTVHCAVQYITWECKNCALCSAVHYTRGQCAVANIDISDCLGLTHLTVQSCIV